MQLKTLKNQVIQNVKSNNFTMAVNGKAFAILAELYKNPIKAIIRELSTNAADSHELVNNSNPFLVDLPTIDKSSFSVRDFGVGLSKDEFENIYFQMFNSTKDNSNKFNGCLGLGKASSLSYHTKTFCIESWKNGIYLRYLCFIGSSGMPEFTLLNEEESLEKTGVRVSVEVKRSDIELFKRYATSVYQWFKLKPNTNIKLEFKNIEHYSENFAIRDGKPLAVMSNVAYPIEHDVIKDNGLILYFEPGEIEFTPSRESLKYSDFTKNKIKEKLEKVKNDIIKMSTNEYSKCNNDIDIIRTRMKYVKFNFLVSTHYYNGKKIETSELKLNESVKCFYDGRFLRRYQGRLFFNLNPEFVLNDLKTGAIARTKRLSKEKRCRAYLFNKLEEIPINIGNSYILASSLPKVEQTRITSQKRLSSFMKLRYSSSPTNSWVQTDINSVTDKVYILRKAYKGFFQGKYEDVREIKNSLQKLNISTEIYGIHPKDELKIVELGFVNINSVYENEIKDIHNSVKNSIYKEYNLPVFELDKLLIFGRKLKEYNIDIANKYFIDLINFIEYYHANKIAIQKYRDNYLLCGNQFNTNPIYIKYKDILDIINQYYNNKMERFAILGYCFTKG